jgi:hypothetical protein
MDYTNYSLGVVLESPLLIIFYGEDLSQISLQFLSAADGSIFVIFQRLFFWSFRAPPWPTKPPAGVSFDRSRGGLTLV